MSQAQQAYLETGRHLPTEFLETFHDSDYEIGCYTEEESKVRAKQLHRWRANNPQLELGLDTFFPPHKGYEKYGMLTVLQLAVKRTDVLLACEHIRIGANVNVLYKSGCSPLLMALQQRHDVQTALYAKQDTHIDDLNMLGSNGVIEQLEQDSRLRRIINVLVEQHADVNCSLPDGKTPLYFAAIMCDWELVQLLLNHGAHRKISPLPSFPEPDDKKRFQQILSSASPFVARPPRTCPCFSGLPLIECHAMSPKPYPAHHTCVCKSGKKFSNCCERRNITVVEEWDSRTHRIAHRVTDAIPNTNIAEDNPQHQMFSIRQRLGHIPIPQGIPGVQGHVVDMLRFYACEQKLNDVAGFFEHVLTMHILRVYTPALEAPGIDPAYKYALQKATFIPWPCARRRSKQFCLDRQIEWNGLVDEYIAREHGHSDIRRRHQIEQAAKLGPALGALYRQCGANQCPKTELKDGVQYRQCAGCSITPYCSRACQKASWPAHKTECGTDGQREQTLPSQALFDLSMWRELVRLM